ncbi:hypothetical protein [Novosphingobium sp. AP12]|nr:hypothetical protein [Novosphingobium sp. AP12]EJL23959.1 hypothetical protein PMI02_03879 [Novosphingobium sp. AP12]
MKVFAIIVPDWAIYGWLAVSAVQALFAILSFTLRGRDKANHRETFE